MSAQYPNLLHPVPVQIEQIDKGTTIYDDDAREPVQRAERKAVVTVPGQANYGSSSNQQYGSGGPREGEGGYVLFRVRDLAAKSITLQSDDRLIGIGELGQDGYITRLQPRGHYPAYGHTLVRAYFSDRQPTKHQRRTA